MKFILFLMLSCSLAQAGVREVGNGGAGVLIQGKPQLLDLYEAGVKVPAIDTEIVPLGSYLKSLSTLVILSPNERTLLAKKLTELRAYSPETADMIVLGIKKYVWRVLDSALVEIPEESPIDLTGVAVVQLANRFGATIRINKKYWELLDEGNRVALVIHEILYAYAPLTDDFSKQESGPVREKVGYLFSPEFKDNGPQGFFNFTGIPRVLTEVRSDSSYERLIDSMYVTGPRNFSEQLIIGSSEAAESFCANVEKSLKLKFKLSVDAQVFYKSELMIVEMKEYQSSNGSQKMLVLRDPFLAVYKNYQTAGHSFRVGKRDSCRAWAQSMNLFWDSIARFPTSPAVTDVIR